MMEEEKKFCFGEGELDELIDKIMQETGASSKEIKKILKEKFRIKE